MKTRVAQHLFGDNLFCGKSTLHELLQGVSDGESLTTLIGMSITGRRPVAAERMVLDAIAIAMCSADPRIWPLKVSRVAASFGNPIAGMSVGELSCYGTLMGPYSVGYAAKELINLHNEMKNSAISVATYIANRKRLAGFGVPLRDEDERCVALQKWLSGAYEYSLYWGLHLDLIAEMKRARNTPPNVGLPAAAALLDLGYNPLQIGVLNYALFQPTWLANAYESSMQQDPNLQRLPEENVEYVGQALRRSPRR